MAALAPDEARAHFGWFARFADMDASASTQRTRARLGGQPTGPTLLEDMERPGPFAA